MLNGINETLFSQKRPVEVRKAPGALISDKYHLKPVLKQNPEYVVLLTGFKDTAKYTPNEVVDKILDLTSLLKVMLRDAKSSFQH